MRPVRALGILLGSVALLTPVTAAHAVPDAEDRQWDMIDIGAPEAQQVATGAGVTVAVIDTGIDVDHPEFAGRIVDPLSWVCPSGVEVPCTGLRNADDGHGHGTHVAGSVAAADDGQGITGVAPDADIMPIRVGEDDGTISGDLTAAVRAATAAEVDVITMSIGYIAGTGPLLNNPIAPVDEFNEAVSEAQEAGILVTLAAGNDAAPYCGQGETWQDAALCVGAYGPDSDPAIYSNTGYEIDVYAPGGGVLTCEGSILSTVPLEQGSDCAGLDGYGTMSGTSMATPHAAGVGALLAEQGVTGSVAAQRIVDTARTNLLWTGPRLDAAAAVGVN